MKKCRRGWRLGKFPRKLTLGKVLLSHNMISLRVSRKDKRTKVIFLIDF